MLDCNYTIQKWLLEIDQDPLLIFIHYKTIYLSVAITELILMQMFLAMVHLKRDVSFISYR
jgi:hypothetical protein